MKDLSFKLMTAGDVHEIENLCVPIRQNRVEYQNTFCGHYQGLSEYVNNCDWKGEAFLIERNSETIGFILLSFIRENSNVNFGLYVKPESRRSGVGDASAKFVLDRCFNFHGLKRVEAYCLGQNEASKKFLSKHFKHEGVSVKSIYSCGEYHDSVLFGLICDDYMKK